MPVGIQRKQWPVSASTITCELKRLSIGHLGRRSRSHGAHFDFHVNANTVLLFHSPVPREEVLACTISPFLGNCAYPTSCVKMLDKQHLGWRNRLVRCGSDVGEKVASEQKCSAQVTQRDASPDVVKSNYCVRAKFRVFRRVIIVVRRLRPCADRSRRPLAASRAGSLSPCSFGGAPPYFPEWQWICPKLGPTDASILIIDDALQLLKAAEKEHLLLGKLAALHRFKSTVANCRRLGYSSGARRTRVRKAGLTTSVGQFENHTYNGFPVVIRLSTRRILSPSSRSCYLLGKCSLCESRPYSLYGANVHAWLTFPMFSCTSRHVTTRHPMCP